MNLDIQMPHKFVARDYQAPLWNRFIFDGFKRAVAVWHRRAGKDKTAVNIVAHKMGEQVGIYYYFFPTYTQGRKILWEGIDKDGMKFTDHFPKDALKKKPNDSTMKIEYKNGSIFRVIGTDNIDDIVGTNPIGCVFSEYSLQDPKAWDFIRPILAENNGWAIFLYTPRGKNHGFTLYRTALNDPSWYVSLLTVEDTKAIPANVLEREKREIIKLTGDDSLYWQEYFCSFETAIQGSYYAKLIDQFEKAGRIRDLPWEPLLPVQTWWDLGIGDAMAIWFTQSYGNEVRVIDYYETSGEGMSYYAKFLSEKPYVYSAHNLPHDAEVKEIGTGKSRKEMAESLGIKPIRVIPKLPVDDGIQAVRALLPLCYFDKMKCEQGLNALISYHKEFDDKRKEFKNHPYHDWSSHAADAFRYLAVGFKSGFQQYNASEKARVEEARRSKSSGE